MLLLNVCFGDGWSNQIAGRRAATGRQSVTRHLDFGRRLSGSSNAKASDLRAQPKLIKRRQFGLCLSAVRRFGCKAVG
jgi:hypothetical protein